MTVQIRFATPADIPEMHRIRTSVRENRLTDPARIQPHDYESLLAEGGRGWVAEVDGRIVGFAVADLARANVWALFVEPGFEGRGIGRRLHDEMTDWLFAAGARSVWLGTDPGTRAEAFYRAAGWKRAGRERNGEIRYEISRQQWLERGGRSIQWQVHLETAPQQVWPPRRGRGEPASMSVQPPTIRMAAPGDAAAVQAIYAPIVRDTVISFEWEVPTVGEIAGRMERVLADGFPWLVAEASGLVIGYAYASTFRARAAYAWTAEVSVYVHAEHHRRGVGGAIYGSLLRLLAGQGYRSAYGHATAPNPASERLHRSLGFVQVGRFPRVGYKFGAWHDVICWRIAMGSQEGAPGPIRRASEVATEAPSA